MTRMSDHLARQMAWSRATFGPGERTLGVSDHIVKELVEVDEAECADDRAAEWVDVAILGLDGLWRALAASGLPWDQIPGEMERMIQDKQSRNETRTWPDWRTAPADKAIEHDRGGEG
jgi:hypothetical protein